MKLTIEQARACWARRQGLSAPVRGEVADVVRAAGWIYSAGSTLSYLALRARLPGIDRATIDRAIFDEGSLLEVPTVRGCTMLVPREDVSLALMAGRPFSEKFLGKVRTACNITDREVRDLSAAVPALLKGGPLTMEGLRERLPANLVRNLGAAGKSLGERSTLSFTMRLLQREAVVQRVAADRRLDSEAFAYRLMNSELVKPQTPEEAEDGLARRFFGWAAPATVKEFAWWAGISQKQARNVAARIGLTLLSVEGWAEEAWIPTEQEQSFPSIRNGKDDLKVNFLPFRDNYLYFRRGIGVLLNEKDGSAEVLDWMRRPSRLGDLDSLHHHAIILDGRLIGYWEYDPDAQEVVWRTCSAPGRDAQKEIKRGIAELRGFVHAQLGDAAFYAFDAGTNRRLRIDSLKRQHEASC